MVSNATNASLPDAVDSIVQRSLLAKLSLTGSLQGPGRRKVSNIGVDNLDSKE